MKINKKHKKQKPSSAVTHASQKLIWKDSLSSIIDFYEAGKVAALEFRY